MLAQALSSSRKASLCSNFGLIFGVGLVAAGRHVIVMNGHRVAQLCLLAQRDADVAAVDLAAIALQRLGIERQPRDHGDAVIALLAVERDVLIAEPLEALQRKGVVRALGFLQAQHVGTDRLEELGNEVDAQPDRIDVPGGELDLHGRNLGAGRRIFHARPDLSAATGILSRPQWSLAKQCVRSTDRPQASRRGPGPLLSDEGGDGLLR